MPDGNKRLFVAVDVGDQVKDSIAAAVSILKERGWKNRWVPPKNIHLTLRFLGDCPSESVEAIGHSLSTAAAQIKPFFITTEVFGAFPKAARAQVLWLGLTPSPEIRGLHALVSSELKSRGFEVESCPYTPHITFGRFKKPKHVELALLDTVKTGHATLIDKIMLFSSHLTSHGAKYEIIMSARLGKTGT